jgi:hypothetical protein
MEYSHVTEHGIAKRGQPLKILQNVLFNTLIVTVDKICGNIRYIQILKLQHHEKNQTSSGIVMPIGNVWAKFVSTNGWTTIGQPF